MEEGAKLVLQGDDGTERIVAREKGESRKYGRLHFEIQVKENTRYELFFRKEDQYTPVLLQADFTGLSRIADERDEEVVACAERVDVAPQEKPEPNPNGECKIVGEHDPYGQDIRE